MEDKVSLTRERAELIQRLSTPISPDERVNVQAALSLVNARLKALNTTEAFQLKAAADRRKVAGLAEAQANAMRARANAGLPIEPEDNDEDDDPGQTKAIDDWFATVLGDSGIPIRRAGGKISYGDVPAKWLVILQRLRAGLHAAARGQELPDAEVELEVKPKPKAKKR
jgi:hypothetical protein